VSDDVPTDVETVLAQLFAAGQDALADDDIDTCRQVIGSAESTAANKLADGERKKRLVHGCERVRALLEEGENETAAEYLRAMDDQLTDPRD
jgi:hypothetical protein